MQKHAYLLFVCSLLAVLLAACAQAQIILTETPTAAPKDTSTSFSAMAILEETATMPPPTEPILVQATTTSTPRVNILSTETGTPGQPVFIERIYMTHASTGWAWGAQNASGETPLLRTLDGGHTWQTISPPREYIYYDGAFLDSLNAWLLYYSAIDGTGGILRTNDGGLNWTLLPQKDEMKNAWIDFSSPTEGIAETASLGAGNAYITHYSTTDGGNTWNPIALNQPSPEASLAAGTVHLCNICGDRMYYDSSRALIMYGDLAGDPTGMLHLSVSLNLGQNWSDIQMPLPAQYVSGYASPLTPAFFGSDGILPVSISKSNPDGTLAFSVLVIYKSTDGGQSWQAAPAILQNTSAQIDMVQILSAQKAFVRCGKNLCASSDGAQSWNTLPESLNFDINSTAADYVTQYTFVDASNGWAISGQSGATTLWQTTDGGLSWNKLAPTVK